MKKGRPVGYILVHESPVARDMEKMKLDAPELYKMMLNDFKDIVSYDFFVEKGNTKMKEYLSGCLYNVGCPIADRFQKKLKRHYIYVGGEDTGHISEFNESVKRLVQKLVTKKGFVLVKDESMEESK